jgi:hypothetical protein
MVILTAEEETGVEGKEVCSQGKGSTLAVLQGVKGDSRLPLPSSSDDPSLVPRRSFPILINCVPPTQLKTVKTGKERLGTRL